jgi:hypothetical protein
MESNKPKLDFLRFEFKYLLNDSVRSEFEQDLNYFMELDHFVKLQKNNRYMVRSLYFDDSSYRHYYEKTDGHLHRTKFRLRTYTNDPSELCATFLEIKGRHNNLVFKHRSQVQNVLEGDFSFSGNTLVRNVLEKTDVSNVKNRFQSDIYRLGIKPVMLVDYLRRAYISKYDPEFRITFDSHIIGTPSPILYPFNSGYGKSAIGNKTVMEVKFRYRVPSWFHKLIQSYELNRVSVSKYCKCIEANHPNLVFEL